MSLKNRKLLKKDIDKIKLGNLELSFLDRVKGNYEKKYSLLKKKLLNVIDENIALEEIKEKYLQKMGNIEQFNDFLEEEMKVKLFDNLQFYPSIINHRVQARTVVDTEINQVMAVLENKSMSIINSIYFPTIENVNKISKGKELLDYFKMLIEIEKDYSNIYRYENIILSKILFDNPIIDFNKGKKSMEVVDDVYVFLENGFGISSVINLRNNKISDLEEKVKNIALREEKTRD